MNAWTLLNQRLRTHASGPFVTFIDGASRVELSATTVENGAAKVANALRDEFDLDPETHIWLDLPSHWQRTVWCAGAWAAGMVVMVEGDISEAELVVTTLPGATHRVAQVRAPITVVSMHPFGLALSESLPPGCSDATVAVRQQPDALLMPAAGSDAPALMTHDGILTQQDVLTRASSLADAWHITRGGRLLDDGGADIVTSWLAAFAVPLVADASVVMSAPGQHLEAEGITASVR